MNIDAVTGCMYLVVRRGYRLSKIYGTLNAVHRGPGQSIREVEVGEFDTPEDAYTFGKFLKSTLGVECYRG